MVIFKVGKGLVRLEVGEWLVGIARGFVRFFFVLDFKD